VSTQSADTGPALPGSLDYHVELEDLSINGHGELTPEFKPEVADYVFEINNSAVEQITIEPQLALAKYNLLHTPRILFKGVCDPEATEIHYDPIKAISIPMNFTCNHGPIDATAELTLEDPSWVHSSLDVLPGHKKNYFTYNIRVKRLPNLNKYLCPSEIIVEADGKKINASPAYDAQHCTDFHFSYILAEATTSASITAKCQDGTSGMTIDGATVEQGTAFNVDFSGEKAHQQLEVGCQFADDSYTGGTLRERDTKLNLMLATDLEDVYLSLVIVNGGGQCEANVLTASTGKAYHCQVITMFPQLMVATTSVRADVNLTSKKGFSGNLYGSTPVTVDIKKDGKDFEIVLTAAEKRKSFPLTFEYSPHEPKASPDALLGVNEIMLVLDKDEDKKLSTDELAHGLAQAKIQLSYEDTDALLKEADKNGNGGLEAHELAAAAAKADSKENPGIPAMVKFMEVDMAGAKQAFKGLKASKEDDPTKPVTFADLDHGPLIGSVDDAVLKADFAKLDANGDGKLQFREVAVTVASSDSDNKIAQAAKEIAQSVAFPFTAGQDVCTSMLCPEGKMLKPEAWKLLCKGSLCGEFDIEQCCTAEPTKHCLQNMCLEDYGLRADANGRYCVEDRCEATADLNDCCDDINGIKMDNVDVMVVPASGEGLCGQEKPGEFLCEMYNKESEVSIVYKVSAFTGLAFNSTNLGHLTLPSLYNPALESDKEEHPGMKRFILNLRPRIGDSVGAMKSVVIWVKVVKRPGDKEPAKKAETTVDTRRLRGDQSERVGVQTMTLFL